jgi:hypothetical protein
MKKKVIWFVSGLLVLVVALFCTTVFFDDYPVIPHSLEGRADCVSCHGQVEGIPYPDGHARKALNSDSCTGCHEARIETEK